MAGSLGYQTAVDIANRALQHCRMRRITAFTDSSANAKETGFVYDKLREAELRCNLWGFATKRAILRPISTYTTVLATSIDAPSGTTLTFTSTSGAATGPVFASNGAIASNTIVLSFDSTTVTLSQAVTGDVPSGTAITFGPQTSLWTPPTYSAATSYAIGMIVNDANGEWWQSKVASNLANTPAPGAYWSHYTGVDYMTPWLTTNTYFTGELVLASDSSVYMSLTNRNGTGTVGNDPTTTSGFWLKVNGTTAGISLFYPLGAGSWPATGGRYAFRLPHGFLRQCPTDPRGSQYLGVPTGHYRDDWIFEGDYLVSLTSGPLLLRYIQNTVDVPTFDPMFCEMLAARMAEECAPILVASEVLTVILRLAHAHYRLERYKAVAVNGIEIGPIDLEVDDYIACRF